MNERGIKRQKILVGTTWYIGLHDWTVVDFVIDWFIFEVEQTWTKSKFIV